VFDGNRSVERHRGGSTRWKAWRDGTPTVTFKCLTDDAQALSVHPQGLPHRILDSTIGNDI
jgi:hypothetical protein